MSSLLKVFKLLSKKRQIQIYIIFFFIILSNVAELFSIGAVIPLLAVLTDVSIVIKFLDQNFTSIIDSSQLNKENLKSNIIIIFVFITLFTGIFRVFTQWLIAKYSFSVQTDISTTTFNSIISQAYPEHIKRNTSEVISAISTKVSLFRNSLFQFLNLVSSIFFITILIGTILLITFKTGIIIITGSIILYSAVWLFCKKMIDLNGRQISVSASKITKILQEAMGSIRDILLNSHQKYYTKIFLKANSILYSAHAKTWFISSSPRIMLETIAMIVLAISALYFVEEGDIVSYIPFLGSLAVASQRFLPALNQVYTGASIILGNEASIKDLIKLIDLPQVKNENYNNNILKFNHSIEFKDIEFSYEIFLDNVLKAINFKINKGDSIGIVGKTGSGKSTLVDILMGLLIPTSGQILIDGIQLTEQNLINWQRQISHVPQNIFLTDLSIKENIAFGINENDINITKVKDIIKECDLSEVISNLPEGLNTKVGEKGIKLSGGQMQRIAIARALYKDPYLIILDEATSGLDSPTEKKIINTINEILKDKTIIMISHKPDTLLHCNKIVTIENGHIKEYKQ